MNIVNIRGSHGAGKSWVVRQVMAGLPPPDFTKMFPDGKHIEGYEWPRLFVVGKYLEGVSTGGCDTIRDTHEIEKILVKQADGGLNALFKGIRVTGGHTQWIDATRAAKQHDWYFLILDTTRERCLENVLRRRSEAGVTIDNLDKVKITIADSWRRCQRQREHFRRAGCRVEYLSPEAAVARARELII